MYIYSYESHHRQSNSPENVTMSWNRHMRSAIRQQLKTKDKEIIRQNLFELFYHIKIRSCDAIVCLFGIRSTWQAVWVSKKGNNPTMSGVVLVLMLVRSLLVWSRLWSKHEMQAAELSDEVEGEVQASAVSVREFRCESHRQTFTGTYFFASISWHLRAILKLVTSTLHNNSCYIDHEALMDWRCAHY